MKNNIIFKVSKDTIIINEIKKEIDYKSLNNTNVIDTKELKFGIDYINENFELVANFLNVIIIKKEIKTVQINSNNVSTICVKLINEWSKIEKIIFKEDKRIDMDTFFLLLDNNYLKEIEVYEIPDILLERIDLNKNIKVKTREKVKNESIFMKENFIESYSDIYYKKSIVISNKDDYEDVKAFIRISSKLKFIKIINYSNELLTMIIDELIHYQKKNILIEINEKNNDVNAIVNSVNYIKKTNRKYFEDNNIKFNLKYSKEYNKNNFIKQLNLKLLGGIIMLVIFVAIITLGVNYYKQYIDTTKIEDELLELNKILDDAEEVKTIDDNENDVDYIDKSNVNVTTTTKKKGSSYSSAYYTNYKQVFDTLLKKNKDTVGWLTVNNTKINYPVVQAETNSYYLNHDFNQRKNIMGWVFMDYRNETDNLDQNTIIYGHNIKTGIMFGSLKKTINSSWYKKESNQIITFNMPGKNMKWKIFSIYRIKETDDYLKTNFDDGKSFLKFIKKLKDRSIYNFNVDVKETDKILTLSTCYQHTSRTVVHAVLIETKETDKN